MCYWAMDYVRYDPCMDVVRPWSGLPITSGERVYRFGHRRLGTGMSIFASITGNTKKSQRAEETKHC